MNDAQFLSVAWNQLIQVSLLTVGVWLLTKLFARNRPHLAHAMWLVVLAKCVTPPLLESPTGLFGHLSVPEPVWFEPEEIVVEEAIEPVVPETRVVASNLEFESEITVDPLSQGYVLEDDTLLGQMMLDDTTFELEGEPVESAAAISQPPVAEPSVTFLPLWKLWLISAGTVMSLIFLRVMCTLWRVKRHRTETPPELLELVQRMSKQFKLRRRVRVLITSSRVGPAVVGLFRPLLILPDVVTNGRSAKELEPIIAHELLHVRRGDLGIGWLQMLVQSLWWFHPLIWLVNRLLNRETERCCDEAVLAELNCSPGRYARCLLNVLEQKRNLTPIPAFPGVKPVELTKQRMERIMKLGQGCRKRSPWWCWLVVLLLGAVVLPGTARSQTDAVTPEKSVRNTESESVAVETTESNQDAQDPRTARVYEVGDLLETLRDEYEFTATEAERALERSVFNALATLEVARKTGQPSIADRLTSQNVCSGSALFAVSNKEGHRQIERLLELWKEHGFYEVTIRGRIATVPVELLKSLPIEKINPATNQAESGGSVTLNQEELDELIQSLQSDTRSNLLSLPQVTMAHGTNVIVMDVVERPIVAGFSDNAPVTEILREGLELHLTSIVREGEVTQLDCEITYTEVAVDDVLITTLKNPDGQPVEVRSPVVDTCGVNVSLLLKSGETTLLRGLKKKSGEVEEELLVFLSATPRKLNREILQPVADLQEQPTGKLLFGTGVNSESGVTGSLVLDERNFDLQAQEQLPNSNDGTGRIESERSLNPDAETEVLLDHALRSYATQLKRELLIDEAALGAVKIPIDHRVKVYSLKTHTAEMALKETLRPLGLTYALHDRKVPNQGGDQPMLLVFEQRLLDNHDGPFPYDQLVEMMLERNKLILTHAGDRVAKEQARLRQRIPHDIHTPTLQAGLELFEKVADVSIEIEPKVLKAAEARFLEARTTEQLLTWEIKDREFLSALRHSLEPLDLIPVVTHRGARHTPQIVVRIVPKDAAESAQASPPRVFPQPVDLSADSQDEAVSTVQVRFQRPEKGRLRIDRTVEGKRISTQYELPVRHNFRAGGQRFRLTFDNIPGRIVQSDWPVPSYWASRKNYSWTLDVPEITEQSRKYLSHNAVPVALTDEDLDQIDAGNLVTKVFYLPTDSAVAGVEVIASTRLDPGIDPVEEAKRRGTIVAVMRSARTEKSPVYGNSTTTPAYGIWPYAIPHPWTPRTLNWEDGAWKLDFSGDSTDSREWNGARQASRKSADVEKGDQKSRVIAKVYPVADLVVPIPGTESDPAKDDPILSKLPDQSKLFKAKKKPLSDSAQPLIDLIEKSIEPESWSGEKAVGTIAFHEQNLSIVIRHTGPVHEKVGELLASLRRKQDLQVSLECLTVQFEKDSFSDFWTNVGIVIDHADANAKNSMKPLIFHGVKRDDFRSKIDQFEAAQVLSFPKVTVFNGVGAQIQISGAEADEDSVPMMHYMIVPTISEDRRTIDVKFAVNAANTLDALTKAKSMTIPDGTSVLIEVTDELLSGPKRTGVPEVDKALRELKKKELGLRTFVLLTPRIIIQEEEEPSLGIPQSEASQPQSDSNTRIGTVTPRIIIQDEEEALLRLPQPAAEPADRSPAPVPANPSP